MIRKSWLVFCFFAGAINWGHSQIIDIGPDISVCAGPVTLTANVDSSFIAGTTPPDTVALIDDEFSHVINIGFPFTFYGNTYTQCVISSNNYITFDLSVATGYCPYTIVNACPNPNPSGGAPASPLNAIMGPWQDINPGVGGTISYQTLGTAPNRVFVVEYCNIPMFSCTGLLFSSQIIIHETTNEIETQIINKPLCTTWNSGRAIHGLHNIDGTIAHIVPGRNSPTQWTTANEGYLFTPVNPTTYNITPITFQPVLLGSPVPPTIEWFEAGNPTPIGTGVSINVNPTTTTTYVATITGSGCSGLSASDTMVLNIGSPVPVIQEANNFCGADSVLLSTTTSYLSYLWSNGATTSTTWVGPGSYTVYVTGPGGCDSTSQPYNVILNTDINGALTLTNPYCLGEPITLSTVGTSPSSGITYHYDLNNTGPYEVTTTATNYNASSAFPTAGNYPINVIAAGPGGCSDTLSAVVQIFNLPTISASVVDPTVCMYNVAAFQGSGFVFNPPGQSSSVASYSWDLNFDGIIDTSGAGLINISEQFTTPGPHQVILTVTSTQGCQRSDTVTVNMVESPTGNILAPTVCGNLPANFSFNSTGVTPTTYNWNFGDPTTTSDVSSSATPTWLYSAPGFYTATLIVGSADGCIDTFTTLTALTPLPSGTVNSTVVCQGYDGTFTFNQTSADSITSYLWSFPSGSPATSTNPTEIVNFPFAGNTNISLIVTNQYGCSDTINYPYLVRGSPLVDIGIYPICISRFTFDPQIIPDTFDYELDWNLGDGTIITDTDTSIFNHVYNAAGDYVVTFTAIDQYGCSATATENVHVNDSLFFIMPNVLVQSSSLGNNKVDMEMILPGFNLCVDYTYTVFDRWGVKVFETHNDPYNPDMFCGDCFKGTTDNGAVLVPGIYYYIIEGNYNILKAGSITIFE